MSGNPATTSSSSGSRDGNLTGTVPRKFIVALLCCSALAAQQLASRYGITLQYAADFTGHSWKQEAKLTQQEIGTDIPEGVAPLRPVLQLKGRLPGRIDDNTIEVTPLADRTVRDFAKAYPRLNSAALALRSLLTGSQLPTMKPWKRPILTRLMPGMRCAPAWSVSKARGCAALCSWCKPPRRKVAILPITAN